MRYAFATLAVLSLCFVHDEAEAGFGYYPDIYDFTGKGGASIQMEVINYRDQYTGFHVRNNSNAGTVTRIYFCDDDLFNDTRFHVYNYTQTHGTYFTMTNAHEAVTSNVKFGLDKGERVYVWRQNADGVDFAEVIHQLNCGPFAVKLDFNGQIITYTHEPKPCDDHPPVVPEPSGLALAGIGVAFAVCHRRRKNAQADSEPTT
ncbi:MAG: hypothetical protein CMJ78_06145 [Planctomycetaceae bacterium]|nr:hypothetical protein [Planctomycetaceae bacterium]